MWLEDTVFQAVLMVILWSTSSTNKSRANRNCYIQAFPESCLAPLLPLSKIYALISVTVPNANAMFIKGELAKTPNSVHPQ